MGVPKSDLLPPPSEPMEVAHRLVDARHIGAAGGLILRHWRGEFWEWQTSHWLEVADQALKTECYCFCEDATYLKTGPNGPTLEPWAPTRHKVGDLVDALRAVTDLSEAVDMPAWLDNRHHLPALELVACANGLLHIPTRTLVAHDHAYFNRVAVPFDYQANPPAPARWLTFLDELWPDAPDAIDALAEFMGYVISGRRDLHKILLLIGPTRAGKGVIARVLKALVGQGNYAGPTLASMGTNFGLSPLIGKPLAIVSDARLGGTNVHQVVERLLSVSGEDMLTVDRKYKEPWTGTLPTRFLVISNELPRFGDASGAIANRFIVLTLRQSWLGRENPALTDELITEMPGILDWALDGAERLNAQGHFTEPKSSRDAIVALGDLVSPTSAFVRDRCEVGPGLEVPCDALYAEWKAWAEENGHRSGSVQMFGRDLRAVLPGLHLKRPRDGQDRRRWFEGVGLNATYTDPDRGPSRTTRPAGEDRPAISGAVLDGPRPAPLWPVGNRQPVHLSQTPRADPQGPLVRNASLHPEDRPTEPSGTLLDAATTVRCSSYEFHRSSHRLVDGGWICEVCDADGGVGQQWVEIPTDLARAAQSESDWLAAPVPEPGSGVSDDWGTIG